MAARTAQPRSRKCRFSSPTMEVTAKLLKDAPALWIETVDCLNERQGGNLDEVVVRLAPIGETTSQLVSKAEVGGDELVANRRSRVRGKLDETVLLSRRRPPARASPSLG